METSIPEVHRAKAEPTLSPASVQHAGKCSFPGADAQPVLNSRLEPDALSNWTGGALPNSVSQIQEPHFGQYFYRAKLFSLSLGEYIRP